MLFYQVKVACSLVDNGKMQKTYEESQNSWHMLIEDINDTLETDANESKIFMTVYKVSPEELFLIAVIDSLESPSAKTLLKYLADCISEKFGLSLQRKAQMKEIERIYTPTHPHKYQGHPVHYNITLMWRCIIMAGRKRKYPIALTTAERNRIKETLRSTKGSNTIKQRCRILLALDCNQNPNTTYDNCAYYLGVSVGNGAFF